MKLRVRRTSPPPTIAGRVGGGLASLGMNRLIALVFLSASLSAATTATWELHSYQDFLRGRMSGLSITRDGRLVMGPRVETVYASDQAQVWSAAQAPDGSVYLGTGNRGRLIRVDASGNGSVVWSADQPEIFALAVDRAGVVYAGTSPDGKIYRIENGRATEYFSPNERYIWSLTFGPDGALYAGTGQRGKIHRITASGQGAVYYETGQAHVTTLAFDNQGRLLAGSEPNGILYRITGTPAKGFVLYDSNLPEIRAIVPAADGTIYAAALGGSVARRASAATSPSSTTGVTVTAPATSITVTDAQAAVGLAPRAAPQATTAATISAPASTVEVTGVERSALYKILADNTVETLWSSKDENIYDVLAQPDGTLTIVTDAQGRVYRIDPGAGKSHEATLVAQTNESDATRLLSSPRGILLASGNVGKMMRLDSAPNTSAWFESPVHDSGTVARWGRLSWVGDARGILFKTRSGNSARPDATWSDWSDAIGDPAKSMIASPNARYIQWRADFSASTGAIDGVTLAYLPQNSAPNVRSITVASAAATKTAAASSSSSSAAFSITVTDTGDATTAAGTQAQTLARPTGQQLQISWQADDPDGDKLSYTLHFRGEEEREWKLLRADMAENTYTLESDVFADGRYFFRVVASDRPSNALDQAKQSELVGPPVLIDNTPPEVKAQPPRKNGTALEIDVDAEDHGSALKRAEYSVDARPWQPVEAADGVTDSARERFLLRLPNFPAGEHIVVIRVYDIAGNAGLAKVVVR